MKSTPIPKRGKNDALRSYSRSYYFLWFEFLKLSPSYLLAHEVATGVRSYQAGDRTNFPRDFELVLAVYKDFGSVYDCSRDQWLERVNQHITDVRKVSLRLRPIAQLRGRTKKAYSQMTNEIVDYLKTDWRAEGRPLLTLLSVPLGMSTTKAVKQLREVMARARKQKLASAVPSRYALASPRIQYRTLMHYMELVLLRAYCPDKHLWQLAGYTNLSATHDYGIDMETVASTFNRAQRNALTALASRAFKNANNVIENAARGVFPSAKSCPNAVAQDWHGLMNRVRTIIKRDKRMEAAAKKLAKSAI